MKKLLKLRDWLTLDEAAEQLGLLYGEHITPADLLRLALDGQMTLSVRFVNNAYAKGGPAVPVDEATQTEFEFFDVKWSTFKGVQINDRWVIELEDNIRVLTGVWDLPMIGAEQLDTEHYYQTLTYGPAIELTCPFGPFVSGYGWYWQIQQHQSTNPTFDQTQLKQPWGSSENFRQASMLPADAVYVLRPESLRDLIARVDATEQAPPPLSLEGPEGAGDAAAKPPERRPRGKPMSSRWPSWVAELAAHVHDTGIPDGEGPQGQDALIAAIEERLFARGMEAPGRSTVQEAVRAVLLRLREAGK